MHLVELDGSIKTAGDAEIALLQKLPPPFRWIGRAADRFAPFGHLLRAVYELVARNRGRLARFVPDVPPVNR